MLGSTDEKSSSALTKGQQVSLRGLRRPTKRRVAPFLTHCVQCVDFVSASKEVPEDLQLFKNALIEHRENALTRHTELHCRNERREDAVEFDKRFPVANPLSGSPFFRPVLRCREAFVVQSEFIHAPMIAGS